MTTLYFGYEPCDDKDILYFCKFFSEDLYIYRV